MTCSAFFLEVNAVNGISATSARETHVLVGSSKTASVYSKVVYAPDDSLVAVFNASATRRFEPRGDPHDPFRSRWATITGADWLVLTTASSALSPRTPE